ncbi:MAG: glucuronate isomerase, partial [Candidatus Hydrogenedentes bacterium]|nr:glucuronate isomerase [Candidatus Hydrogenedentota bacterium]
YDDFWALPKSAQAEAIWQTLFLDHAPLSEACRGVLTVLGKLGLDLRARNLAAYRAWFAEQEPDAYINKVFQLARIKSAVVTNDPFDDAERPVWEGGYTGDPRFHAALRIDPLLNNWPNAAARLKGCDYNVSTNLDDNTFAEVRRFLKHWVKRMNALYMAVSLPPDFAFPEDSSRARIIEHAILPVAREFNIPFALMIGVKRQVNPALRLGGDGVGLASVDAVEHLCAQFSQNKFLVTLLARENQHALCVAARKFRNLLVFGCWWFLNNPSLIEEMTRMRLELLGPSIIPQHSDARVLDQVIYKWDHSREIIARVLEQKYADLAATGWMLQEAEIRRDVEALLGGVFWRFLDQKL